MVKEILVCDATYRLEGRAFHELNGNGRYSGQFKTPRKRSGSARVGMADGYGVLEGTRQTSSGNPEQFTASGQWVAGREHGYCVYRWAHGAIVYGSYVHGKAVQSAVEHTDGTFSIDGQPCLSAEPRFAFLKRAALEVEVRVPQATPPPPIHTHPHTHTLFPIFPHSPCPLTFPFPSSSRLPTVVFSPCGR